MRQAPATDLCLRAERLIHGLGLIWKLDLEGQVAFHFCIKLHRSDQPWGPFVFMGALCF